MSFSTTPMSASPLFININDQRIGNLPPWVGLNAWRPSARPEIRAALASDVCQAAQHGILAFAVELEVFLFPDTNADHARCSTGCIAKSLPFVRLKSKRPSNTPV